MKNIIKSLALFIIVFLTSCEDEKFLTYDPGNSFVQLTAPNSSKLFESSTDTFVIPVQYGGDISKNTNGISVEFTINAADASRFTISPANGELLIAAGEGSANIEITPIDNLYADGDLNIELVLSGGDLPLGIGGEGLLGKSVTVSILDDDCPFDINDFVGAYSALQSTTSFDDLEDGNRVVAELGPEPNTLLLTGLIGSGRQATIELDASNLTNPVVIHRSLEFGTVFQSFASTGPLGTFAFAEQEADNIFNICSKTIQLTFYRAQINGTGAYTPPYFVRLTKQ